MVDISRKSYERNDIKIVDDDGILWLNEKHVGERLDHRKHRYELVEEPKKQCNRFFMDEKLAVKVIMDLRTTSAHKFNTTLGFKQYDVILTKQQSVLTKMMSS